MQSIISPAPEKETFSTPPSSPIVGDRNILDRPSLSRRGSRPSNLRISESSTAQWKPDVDIVHDSQQSPNAVPAHAKVPTPSTAVPQVNGRVVNGGPPTAASALSPLAAPGVTQASGTAARSPRPSHLQSQRQSSPMRSPCFVHSQLQGPSFNEWLRTKHLGGKQEIHEPRVAAVSPIGGSYSDGTLSDGSLVQDYYEDTEEETASSLTKQLAETAVGVREISKQLGALFSSHFCRRGLIFAKGGHECTQTFSPSLSSQKHAITGLSN